MCSAGVAGLAVTGVPPVGPEFTFTPAGLGPSPGQILATVFKKHFQVTDDQLFASRRLSLELQREEFSCVSGADNVIPVKRSANDGPAGRAADLFRSSALGSRGWP